MNSNNFTLADILGMALKGAAKAADVIDVTPVSAAPIKYTASMPVKAIFNVKTEEMVPVLDEDGNPKFVAGENGKKRMVKQAKKLEKPVLASKVFFEDGSWTIVKNSGEDTIDLVEVKLPNGNTVVTASDASKERALAYAVVKHAFGRVNPSTKEVYGANLGRRFEKVLKASVDQRVSTAQAKAKAEKRNESKPASDKPRKPSRGCGRADVDNFVKNAIAEITKALLEKYGDAVGPKGEKGA